MKVIFLDIDGVLNSGDCMRAYHLLWKDKLGISRDTYGQLFDERCVMWLQYIIGKTGAKIVVSSTWRLGGLKKMQDMWNHRGLPGEVIGITPASVDDKLFDMYPGNKFTDRGYEIQDWIEQWQPKKYVILDDSSDMLQHQRFVKCNTDIGLTNTEANKAISYLI